VPTPAERSALLFVAAVAALGLGVRGCRAVRPAAAPLADRAALAQQLAAVDSAIASGGRRPARGPRGAKAHQGAPRAQATTPAAVGPVDLDHASAVELDRLPGIGPSLAARIVADRDSAGPFGSLEGLQRVRGIGPALAAKISPFVVFSGRPPPRGR
jgi:competence protein ComEA